MAKSETLVIEDDFKGFPVNCFCIANGMKNDLENVLIPGGLVEDRIERMACDVATEMGEEHFTALCVLKGGHQFFSSLVSKIRQFYRLASYTKNANKDFDCDQIREEFIRIKSYEDNVSTGKVQIFGIENLESLKNKNVLIVEDIIDSGKTMQKLLQTLKDYELKSCRVSALFLKRNEISKLTPDFVGFEIPDKFIVGCSLDYNERFRGLNHVCILNENARIKYSNKSNSNN
ncbi:hypoxanthine-guanine phosphoribosyltransferase-like protein [Leptotrombidium deliense]|uniref:Hypoxanthine phosphoribosyltransferase n=1 Tax=Leptotrombidium deliense TaxID=299467 RepID=A0A443SWN2_9ACAR|nr:hypoxanthine-guanine phosphoribosyltransferase-like protein [Leptotrombidium deliense]